MFGIWGEGWQCVIIMEQNPDGQLYYEAYLDFGMVMADMVTRFYLKLQWNLIKKTHLKLQWNLSWTDLN